MKTVLLIISVHHHNDRVMPCHCSNNVLCTCFTNAWLSQDLPQTLRHFTDVSILSLPASIALKLLPPSATGYLSKNPKSAAKMCQTSHFKSSTCQHLWLAITRPCQPGAGWINSLVHDFKLEKNPGTGKATYISVANACPICDRKGLYDCNIIRFSTGKPLPKSKM